MYIHIFLYTTLTSAHIHTYMNVSFLSPLGSNHQPNPVYIARITEGVAQRYIWYNSTMYIHNMCVDWFVESVSEHTCGVCVCLSVCVCVCVSGMKRRCVCVCLE